MKKLFVIPARGGSKGIPGKNIKQLGGKPLIHYSLEYARQFTGDADICVSTDSEKIAESVKDLKYDIPFLRPANLATDQAGSFEVLKHALSFYEKKGRNYELVVLLQPTSPFREKSHLEKALVLFEPAIDMVVSVKESAANPYFNLFEEDEKGFLRVSKGDGKQVRRQDLPKVYEYNGSIYIINAGSLDRANSFADLKKIRKYEMSEQYSIDLDTLADWQYAEFICSQMENH